MSAMAMVEFLRTLARPAFDRASRLSSLAGAMAGRTTSPSKRRSPKAQLEAISQEMDIPNQTSSGLLEK
jgi:hypothetical protein